MSTVDFDRNFKALTGYAPFHWQRRFFEKNRVPLESMPPEMNTGLPEYFSI